MQNNKNISKSALTVFEILKKLYADNLDKKEFCREFSAENFNIYLNTLRKVGFEISYSKEKSGFYTLNNSVNFLNINDDDIELLSSIKNILAENGSFKDICKYNILLKTITKYCDKNYSQKITEIIEKPPFGINLHPVIKKLEHYIDKNIPLLVIYNSPISKTNYFEIFPINLKIENLKLYLVCYDNNLQETRYLRTERILNIKEIQKEKLHSQKENYAICKFKNTYITTIENDFYHKIIDENEDMILTKIYFANKFEFFQKILNYGTDCKIIEPEKIQTDFKQIVMRIKENYACKN